MVGFPRKVGSEIKLPADMPLGTASASKQTSKQTNKNDKQTFLGIRLAETQTETLRIRHVAH